MADKADRIGALGVKTGPKGDYFTGEITVGYVTQKIVVFFNTFKSDEKQPDWHVFKSRPKAETH